MKCDVCITGDAKHKQQFSLLKQPGIRLVADIDICDICNAICVNVANAIFRKGREWRIPMQKPVEKPSQVATLTQEEIARQQGYTGDICPECGNFKMKRTGPCLTCEGCGHNTGC